MYRVKDFKNSALAFSEAFKIPDSRITRNHRYNAACTWALANNPDSAFYYLNYIATKMNYTDYGHIKGDPDFKSLYSDKRWQSIIDLVKANKPVVVFENGMASSFGGWDIVVEDISKTNAVFRYNRPRIGESQNDSLPPTTMHIVNNLRKMLLQKGLKSPYLLVSHSLSRNRIDPTSNYDKIKKE